MCWLNRTLFTVLFLLFASPAVAQGPAIEYGSPKELRGVVKIFVDTGMDAQQRNKIVREIQKRLPRLIVVAGPEEADIHLRFGFSDREPGSVVVYPNPHPIPIPVPGGRGMEGIGTVFRRIGTDRLRVLLSFRDAQGMFEREPSVNFARKFVREYERANN